MTDFSVIINNQSIDNVSAIIITVVTGTFYKLIELDTFYKSHGEMSKVTS